MANIAIFASGSGTNYEALAEKFQNNQKHHIKLLICDRENAFVIQRAQKYSTPVKLINYKTNTKPQVESYVLDLLTEYKIDIVFLAGFMRIFSEDFVKQVKCPIINLHPSLLPKYRGAHAIEQAIASDDNEIGISFHYVNEILDGGEIILQKSITLDRRLSPDEIEQNIHDLEHLYYPLLAEELCDKL